MRKLKTGLPNGLAMQLFKQQKEIKAVSPKVLQHMHGNIPNMFDCQADPAVRLLAYTKEHLALGVGVQACFKVQPRQLILLIQVRQSGQQKWPFSFHISMLILQMWFWRGQYFSQIGNDSGQTNVVANSFSFGNAACIYRCKSTKKNLLQREDRQVEKQFNFLSLYGEAIYLPSFKSQDQIRLQPTYLPTQGTEQLQLKKISNLISINFCSILV